MAMNENYGGFEDLPNTKVMTLAQLRASLKPMTVLERVEQAALGLIEMTSEELAAARLYLAKTQPDLKAEEHTGANGGAIEHNHHHTVEFVGTNTVTPKA